METKKTMNITAMLLEISFFDIKLEDCVNRLFAKMIIRPIMSYEKYWLFWRRFFGGPGKFSP